MRRPSLKKGKLVHAMDCQGFPGIFTSKNSVPFGMQLPLRIRPLAEEKVASTLNRLADRAFLDVLSPLDKSSIADLSWAFRGDSGEGKPGS